MKWHKKQPVVEVPLEVKVNKDVRKSAVEDAKQANEQLKAILEENHFTLYLAVAAGAKLKTKGV